MVGADRDLLPKRGCVKNINEATSGRRKDCLQGFASEDASCGSGRLMDHSQISQNRLSRMYVGVQLEPDC